SMTTPAAIPTRQGAGAGRGARRREERPADDHGEHRAGLAQGGHHAERAARLVRRGHFAAPSPEVSLTPPMRAVSVTAMRQPQTLAFRHMYARKTFAEGFLRSRLR